MDSFTADAVILDDNVQKHWRERDHQGTFDESLILTSGDLAQFGDFPTALRELWLRVFVAELPYFTADAVIA